MGNLVDVNTEPLATVTSLDPVHVTIAVSVTTAYPGANAEVVEQSVAAPIEAQVNGVDDMLYMSSTSTNDGGYALMVTFEVGADPDITAVNVQNRVAVATGQLPQEVTRQGVVTQKQSLVPESLCAPTVALRVVADRRIQHRFLTRYMWV